MNPKSFASPSLLFFSFFLLFHSSTAFNITKILGQYPDFSTYNDYLTQTQVAAAINQRQTITVLVVDNSAVSRLSGKSIDEIKKILSLHVVLDYYDLPKLQKLSNKTSLLTTLFQSSGLAIGEQGFLNVTDLSTGAIAFGPATKGSTLGANLVKSVVSQPYNISVLQISTVIIPPGNSTAPPPPSTAAPAATPKSSPPKANKAPPPSDATPPSPTAPTKSAVAPPPSDDTTVSPSDAPSGASPPPSDATAPSKDDSPLSSPPATSVADAPVLAASAPSPTGDSSGSSAAYSPIKSYLGVFVMMIVASVGYCI